MSEPPHRQSQQCAAPTADLLAHLQFTNHFAALGPDFSTRVKAQPLENPRLVDTSPQAFELLDLKNPNTDSLVKLLNGEATEAPYEPVASIYAGHQFGAWVSQLGDGRALILGQVRNSRDELWELQLKGSGQTPYSRFADGRAVLRSTIREYLCSEAMAALGVPTTRALGMIDSQTRVFREDIERSAMLLRLAPSLVRFGSFELFASRQQTQQVKVLADHLLNHYRPHLLEAENPYLALYGDVIERTAQLIAQWQSVGFSHGVMNTDNMSMLGLTIDYGPFGFMESYQPGYVCNHSDHSGRYAFNRQPDIAWWNLACLGNALLSLIPLEAAKSAVETFRDHYQSAFRSKMQNKLGLMSAEEGDAALIEDWLQLMHNQSADFTLAFRALSHYSSADSQATTLADIFSPSSEFNDWLNRYRLRIEQQPADDKQRQELMQANNPLYILRNYLAQEAIERAEDGDYSGVRRLREVLSRPFEEQAGCSDLALPLPANQRQIAVSCSS